MKKLHSPQSPLDSIPSITKIQHLNRVIDEVCLGSSPVALQDLYAILEANRQGLVRLNLIESAMIQDRIEAYEEREEYARQLQVRVQDLLDLDSIRIK